MSTPTRRTVLKQIGGGLIVLPVLAAQASATEAASVPVEIKGMAFDPAELTIPAGTTVTFTNQDNAPHTATAEDGSFDTPRLGKGESADVTFATAGTFPYYCAVHRNMKAVIIVT